MLHGFDLTALARRVILMEGWRAAFLAIFCGALSALALAPVHAFPILLITIPVFIWLLDGALPNSGKRGLSKLWPAFRTGWLFGFGYFLGGLWWLGQAFLVDADGFAWALPIAVVGLPAFLALFWGVGAAIARLGWGHGWLRLLAFAAALTVTEYLRGTMFTGFPWNLPGYALMPSPLMMQTSGLIGTYGVTFLTLLVASAPAIFAPSETGQTRRIRLVLISASMLLIGHIGYGVFVLGGATNASVPGAKLRLVQPAIDQRLKWDPAQTAPIFRSYLDLSRSNTGPKTSGPSAFTHIIWPESAFPFILAEQQQALAAIADLLPEETILLTGAMRREPPLEGAPEPDVFNALLALNGNGEIFAARDKTHLVPFGEYLPMQEFLESLGLQQLTKLRGGFAAGSSRTLVEVPNAPKLLSLICYEIIYPGAIDTITERPGWIVNLTNDAWFGQTAGPYQHAHQARLRAVEIGVPVVRLANGGISFVADAYGRINERLPLGFKGVLDSDLPVAIQPTLYARTGNLPVIAFSCILILILVGVRVRNTRKL